MRTHGRRSNSASLILRDFKMLTSVPLFPWRYFVVQIELYFLCLWIILKWTNKQHFFRARTEIKKIIGLGEIYNLRWSKLMCKARKHGIHIENILTIFRNNKMHSFPEEEQSIHRCEHTAERATRTSRSWHLARGSAPWIQAFHDPRGY